MKFTSLAAAAAIVATAVMPGLAAPAAAQRTVVHERTVVHNRTEHRGWQSRKVCRVERHHGHRTRVCRSVRFR